MELVEQLLSGQLLPVLLVLADDDDLPLIDQQPVLVLPVPDRLHVLVYVSVPEAVVPLETSHEDLIRSRLTSPVTEVGNSGVLNADLIEEGKIGPSPSASPLTLGSLSLISGINISRVRLRKIFFSHFE